MNTSTSNTSTRTITIKYRKEAIAAGKKPAKLTIPRLSDTDIDSISAEVIRPLIEREQDQYVREQYEAGVSSYTTDLLSLIAWMSQSSQRLTGEAIKEWFASEVEEALTLAIAAKLGVTATSTPAQIAKLDATVTVYRDKLAALASGRTAYLPEVCDQLLRAIALAEAETSTVGANLVRKLEAMKAASTSTDLLNVL